jgi:hypothetical protein
MWRGPCNTILRIDISRLFVNAVIGRVDGWKTNTGATLLISVNAFTITLITLRRTNFNESDLTKSAVGTHI